MSDTGRTGPGVLMLSLKHNSSRVYLMHGVWRCCIVLSVILLEINLGNRRQWHAWDYVISMEDLITETKVEACVFRASYLWRWKMRWTRFVITTLEFICHIVQISRNAIPCITDQFKQFPMDFLGSLQGPGPTVVSMEHLANQTQAKNMCAMFCLPFCVKGRHKQLEWYAAVLCCSYSCNVYLLYRLNEHLGVTMSYHLRQICCWQSWSMQIVMASSQSTPSHASMLHRPLTLWSAGETLAVTSFRRFLNIFPQCVNGSLCQCFVTSDCNNTTAVVSILEAFSIFQWLPN